MQNYEYKNFPRWIYFENGAKTIVKDEKELSRYTFYSDNPNGPFPKPEDKKTEEAQKKFSNLLKKSIEITKPKRKGRKPKNDS